MKFLGNFSSVVWIIAIFAIIVGAAITAHSKKKGQLSIVEKAYKYFKKETVLTKNEQEWYWRLVESLPRNVILAQVNMSSCIDTKNHKPSFGTISQKSLDFVICSKELKIIAAIEIDDNSHFKPEAKKRDTAKDKALDTAGIKLIRWKATPVATKEEIIKSFTDVVLGRNNEKHQIS